MVQTGLRGKSLNGKKNRKKRDRLLKFSIRDLLSLRKNMIFEK
jgi:hypothetical protein